MIIGIAIVFLGILFLIGIFYPNFYIDFDIIWPAILIIIGMYYIVRDKKCNFFQGFLLFFGLWFLLVNTRLIVYPYTKAFWPILLIIVGSYIIVTSLEAREMIKRTTSEEDRASRKKYLGVFSGVEEKIKNDDFKGAEVYCIFGGVDLDLRELDLKEDAIINVYSVFGGGTLLVSDKYNLVCNSTALFGSNDNKAENTHKKSARTLTVNCISFCGGTEIK